MEMKDLLQESYIKLVPSRAWRTYRGGKLLDEMEGKKEAADSNFPEAWIMSVVRAFNAGREEICEGLSMIEGNGEPISLRELLQAYPEELLGAGHVCRYGATPGVLAKIIDAAERLTIQVHPDKAAAKRLFDSEFGKTECWYCLGGRTIDGQKPCIYLGFKEGISPEKWEECFLRQDISGMLDCLHRFEIEKGDVFLIEGGTPHAIGAGCLLVEIQEPTDYTIRVERTTPSGLKVPDSMCHQGLGFERMMECFQYIGYSEAEALRRFRIAPRILENRDFYAVRLIGYERTPFFQMDYMEIEGGKRVELEAAGFSGIYILSGSGFIGSGGQKQRFRMTDQFFLPASGKNLWVQAETAVWALRVYGPES